MAQPALGMQICQLEESLGVALFVRHSRGVEPTAACALLHARARAILALIAALGINAAVRRRAPLRQL